MTAIALETLLADPARAGAFYVAASEAATLRATAQALGHAPLDIDLHGASRKDTALAAIAQALQAPAWFGGNWDALADVLGDLSWRPAPGYLLCLDGYAAWRAADPDGFDTLVAILDAAATEWAAREVPFWALLPVADETMAGFEG